MSRPMGRSPSSATRISFPASRLTSSMRAMAELFKNSGARYVVPVAEHHDGFPMYDCSFTDWSAAKMGPKRISSASWPPPCGRKGSISGFLTPGRALVVLRQGMLFDSDVKDPAISAFTVRPGARIWPRSKQSRPTRPS